MQDKIKVFIKKIIEDYFLSIQQYHRIVADKPSEVHLSVTENCCLQCKMCDIWKIKEKQDPLNYRTGKKIICKLREWLGPFNLTFAGGEPFLNKDILKIIKYANDKNIKTSTNSNGFVIDKNLAKKICESGLSTIFFSIDGLEKEHDYIRGRKDTFKKVLNAILFIKNSDTNNKPKIYINTVISNNNILLIGKMIELAKKLGVEGINFQTIMPNFASTYKNDWWKYNPLWPKSKKIIKNSINELIENKKKLGNYILNSQRNIQNFEKYLLDPNTYQKEEKCFVGLNNLMVDTSGNVRLCYEMDKIGNILEDDPNLIWKGPKAKIIRKQIEQCKKPCKLLPCNITNYSNILKRKIESFNKFFENK